MIAVDSSAFVLSAYGISALALLLVAGWIVFDARRARRELARLEAGGARRRSDGGARR
ncbi:hypothetical protein GCM10011390_14040 [Aureimonas endophytica]|uniref:Heme exporter protein D n=1 Tax=Aureimonas endophytica TaxID=2027858 RepID=A0A917E380_9HYPH|nr:heme exporter protein CcmD [Aureimonas endophytica]GGD96438.1 hypothetical protein GCM10011390_14040 [Aureimonas endophytica]